MGIAPVAEASSDGRPTHIRVTSPSGLTNRATEESDNE